MVDAMSKRFDPAEHLHKQGWKGKGTALKNGHLTRPLAVVQKKTLSGVGKDRDEAVPFWDQIFASTAASLSLPSTPHSLSPVPGSTPPPSYPTGVRLADPRSNKASSWQTSGSSTPVGGPSKSLSGLSVGTRISRDMARRGLYSRFLRGTVIVDPEPDSEDEAEEEEAVAGPSRQSIPTPQATGTADIVSKEPEVPETKEERRARRAARAARKAEKEAKRADRGARKRAATIPSERTSRSPDTITAHPQHPGENGSGTTTLGDIALPSVKKRKKRERDGEPARESAAGAVPTALSLQADAGMGELPVAALAGSAKAVKQKKRNGTWADA